MYGAISDYIEQEEVAGRKSPHFLKWLDYSKLCAYVAFRVGREKGWQSSVELIKFYSAIPRPKPTNAAKRDRHLDYVQALETTGVEVLLGHFKVTTVSCRECGDSYQRASEKESDVHLAIDLVADSLNDKIDVAVVLTRDSDIAPAFRLVKNETKVQIVTVVLSPREFSKELLAESNMKLILYAKHLEKNLLPAEIAIAYGFYYLLLWAINTVAGRVLIAPTFINIVAFAICFLVIFNTIKAVRDKA